MELFAPGFTASTCKAEIQTHACLSEPMLLDSVAQSFSPSVYQSGQTKSCCVNK